VRELLLTVDVNSTTDAGQKYPLQFACERKNSSMVKLLVEHGADITARNMHGQTVCEWIVVFFDNRSNALVMLWS
jgi:ankyrin repeat protein